MNQIAHQLNMQAGTVDHTEVQRALVAVREVLEIMGVLWGRR